MYADFDPDSVGISISTTDGNAYSDTFSDTFSALNRDSLAVCYSESFTVTGSLSPGGQFLVLWD